MTEIQAEQLLESMENIIILIQKSMETQGYFIGLVVGVLVIFIFFEWLRGAL